MEVSDAMVYLSVFGAIAVFVAVLAALAFRIRRADDARSIAWRAAQVATECEALLVGPGFLWSVWQNTDQAAAMTIQIRDHQDAVISTVTVPALPLDGVLRRFEFDGRHYEIYKPGLMAHCTCLRASGSAVVLASAGHELLKTTFYRGDGDRELFVLPIGSALRNFRPCLVAEQEVGKLIVELKRNK